MKLGWQSLRVVMNFRQLLCLWLWNFAQPEAWTSHVSGKLVPSKLYSLRMVWNYRRFIVSRKYLYIVEKTADTRTSSWSGGHEFESPVLLGVKVEDPRSQNFPQWWPRHDHIKPWRAAHCPLFLAMAAKHTHFGKALADSLDRWQTHLPSWRSIVIWCLVVYGTSYGCTYICCLL